MITITKIFRFEAAHSLPNHSGSCKHLHGHSYSLHVEVGGEVDTDENSPTFGMIMDFGKLKRIVNQRVVNVLDHNNLNSLGLYPTAEHLLKWILYILKIDLNLVRLRLYETADCYAEWRKE